MKSLILIGTVLFMIGMIGWSLKRAVNKGDSCGCEGGCSGGCSCKDHKCK